MRILAALGGNALLRRGEAMTAENQRRNIHLAAQALAPLAGEHQLVITHGNGPQVGLLALQAASYSSVEPYPLDVLGAQTEGMIGYVVEQELGNLLPFEQPFATVLCMTEVDPADPAFANPTKFIGPVYSRGDAERIAREKGWAMKADGPGWRRVVASPKPKRIFQHRPIRWLLEHGVIVICAGGGGIPTLYGPDGKLHGCDAVVDKDRASALLARQLEVDRFLIVTDADAVFVDWGTPAAKRIRRASPDALRSLPFPEGSMGPKVESAIDFAEATGHLASIGALDDIARLLTLESGTHVSRDFGGLEFA